MEITLGSIGFCSPTAHIAIIKAEVVKDQQWLTRSPFLDLLQEYWERYGNNCRLDF
jgi:chromate transport protein ChrA